MKIEGNVYRIFEKAKVIPVSGITDLMDPNYTCNPSRQEDWRLVRSEPQRMRVIRSAQDEIYGLKRLHSNSSDLGPRPA